MREILVYVLLTLFSGIANAAALLDVSAVTTASLVSRKSSVGSHMTRAAVSALTLPPKALTALLEPVTDRLISGKCKSRGEVSIKVEPETARDHIGGTSSALSGIGLYVSLPDATVSSVGNWYVAPFVALTVTVSNDRRAIAGRLVEHDIHRVERDQMGSANFLDLSPDELWHSISPFVARQYESALEQLLTRVCS